MALEEYRRKRDFGKTPEPAGKPAKAAKGRKKKAAAALSFVIQKHAATRLHYDFRLEMEGVLRSWAVPKGPSLDPGEKRLAVHVEDHPLDYGGFEGIIPKGQYGGGTVLLWDRGTWIPEEDPVASYRKGKLKFRLEGEKLQGGWTLVRMHGEQAGENQENWLLIKEKDEEALPGTADAIVKERPESVETGLSLEEIAADPDRVWQSNREEKVKGKKARKAAPAAALDPSSIPGAKKAALSKLPQEIEPQLATLVSDAPRGDEWIFELKYDGYRALCRVENGKAHLITRSGKDWTHRFTPIARAAEALPVREAILDGEVVVLQPNGTTNFQALQNALNENRDRDLVFFAFDLLYLDGYDLRKVPLLARKEALAEILPSSQETIRGSDHVQGEGESFFRQACGFGLEGVIAKRSDLGYHSGRSKDWVKVKCIKRQEFVIAGFTDPEGSRAGLGALALGVYEDGKDGNLVFTGKVGTGFNQETLLDLRERLEKIERKESPFSETPRELAREAARGSVHWVKPALVAEVAFTEWTRDGSLRHPTFQGLREDKPAREVVREKAEPRAAAEKAAKAQAKTSKAAKAVKAVKKGEIEVAGVRLSHPDKILFPGQEVTKRELALYYERISGWILPHIAGRPLTLVRCPEGQGKQCFYQKHVTEQFPPSIHRVKIEEGGDQVHYGAVDSVEGLISLVQMGVLELHVWGAHRDRVEKPDYAVFDLDPDEGLAWERVVEGANLMRMLLKELGLTSFLKTTGGKGLHVVFPLARRHSWDEVKAFTKALSEAVVAAEPGRYTAKITKASRKGRIFIDYLRNGRGATSISAYSTRARDGAPISTPLHWDELESDVRANTFNVRNLPERLESLGADPWEGFFEVRQSLTAAIKKAVGME